MKLYIVCLIGLTLGTIAFFLPFLVPLYIGLSVAFLGYGIVLLHSLIRDNQKTP